MPEEHVPVLIVGGGGAGLTASMLLARLGVVAWRNPNASQAPAEELANALTQILARPIGVPTPA